jgi:tRNA A-37 threonylcarbamoyl transferase component Bud32
MLCIDRDYQEIFQQLGLTSLDSIVRYFLGTDIPSRTGVVVRSGMLLRPQHESIAVFYKHYAYRKPSWKFLGRPSKARCEFRNYAVFKTLGLPSATRIACGEQRDRLGRLRYAFVITQAIPRAVNLVDFAQKYCPERVSLQHRVLRGTLLRQLADITRRMHDAHFFHRDFVWRNILVTRELPAEPQLWFIDCPRGGFDHWSPFRRQRRIKDLASLDKVASRLCSPGERIVFLKKYLSKPRRDREVRRMLLDTLAYRKRRWPEDWKA